MPTWGWVLIYFAGMFLAWRLVRVESRSENDLGPAAYAEDLLARERGSNPLASPGVGSALTTPACCDADQTREVIA